MQLLRSLAIHRSRRPPGAAVAGVRTAPTAVPGAAPLAWLLLVLLLAHAGKDTPVASGRSAAARAPACTAADAAPWHAGGAGAQRAGAVSRRPDKLGSSSILITILQALPSNFTAYTWDVAASAAPVTQTLALQPGVNRTANISYTTTYLRRHGKV